MFHVEHCGLRGLHSFDRLATIHAHTVTPAKVGIQADWMWKERPRAAVQHPAQGVRMFHVEHSGG